MLNLNRNESQRKALTDLFNIDEVEDENWLVTDLWEQEQCIMDDDDEKDDVMDSWPEIVKDSNSPEDWVFLLHP